MLYIMPLDVLMRGSPQLADNFVLFFTSIVLAIDHVKNIFVVMSWDVLSAVFFDVLKHSF